VCFPLQDDDLLAALEASGIPVELCITSNLMSGSTQRADNHHFRELYGKAHPVILCTDDKQIFHTTLGGGVRAGREDVWPHTHTTLRAVVGGNWVCVWWRCSAGGAPAGVG